MKIFVTGGTGFIGSHLVPYLIQQGHSVTCLVRKTSRTAALTAAGAALVYGDVNDCEAILSGMQGSDWLFHLANLYSMWLPDPGEFTRVNIDGTRNVLEAALQAGIQKVIYVSTVAVFGKPAEIPFNEACIPGAKLFSEYARTKAAADQIAWQLFQEKGLPLVALYPGIVLGAGDDKPSGVYIRDIVYGRVPSVIFKNSIETYVYVKDVCTAILRAAEKPDNLGEKYLIGNEAYNGLDYVRLLCEAGNMRMPPFRLPDWMVMSAAYLLTGLSSVTKQPPWWGLSVEAGRTLQAGFYYSGEKACRELGLTYTPIRVALKESVDWYRQRRVKA